MALKGASKGNPLKAYGLKSFWTLHDMLTEQLFFIDFRKLNKCVVFNSHLPRWLRGFEPPSRRIIHAAWKREEHCYIHFLSNMTGWVCVFL